LAFGILERMGRRRAHWLSATGNKEKGSPATGHGEEEKALPTAGHGEGCIGGGGMSGGGWLGVACRERKQGWWRHVMWWIAGLACQLSRVKAGAWPCIED